MNKNAKKTAHEERMAHAERDLKRMQEEIAPFVKKRPSDSHTTAGQWRDTRTAVSQRSLPS